MRTVQRVGVHRRKEFLPEFPKEYKHNNDIHRRQILNRQIIDTDLDNPFVWVSVGKEYVRNNNKLEIVANHPDLPGEDQAQERSQFLSDLPTFYEVDPTQPVFLTSFYLQV